MLVVAAIFGVVFALLAMVGVALIMSIVRGQAWQGSKLSLPVKSSDPEVIRHVHRASIPLLAAITFIALAHGATLLTLVFINLGQSSSQIFQTLAIIIAAGVVTTLGLAVVLKAYVSRPYVK